MKGLGRLCEMIDIDDVGSTVARPAKKIVRGAIDPEAAFALKLSGYSWRRVGEIMADQQNRVIRFTGGSCSQAVYFWLYASKQRGTVVKRQHVAVGRRA